VPDTQLLIGFRGNVPYLVKLVRQGRSVLTIEFKYQILQFIIQVVASNLKHESTVFLYQTSNL